MQRLSAEEFIAQVLDKVEDLPPDLRKRLLEIASASPATRVREFMRAFQEEACGERMIRVGMQSFRGAPRNLQVELPKGASVVLFGENATGKSTVADALEW